MAPRENPDRHVSTEEAEEVALHAANHVAEDNAVLVVESMENGGFVIRQEVDGFWMVKITAEHEDEELWVPTFATQRRTVPMLMHRVLYWGGEIVEKEELERIQTLYTHLNGEMRQTPDSEFMYWIQY
jgi:hypothetical protein